MPQTGIQIDLRYHMKKGKGLVLLLMLGVASASCNQNKDKGLIVGTWHYERVTTGELRTRADSLTHVLSEMVYDGSTLVFYNNDSFEMINKDTASSLQGKGFFELDAKNKTLTLERSLKNGVSDKMAVQVLELTKDSLKIGGPNEVMVYSRAKE